METIAIMYFSGTGNTRYIAHRLYHMLDKYQAVVCSICSELDFDAIISNSDFVFLCYPVYGSTAPKIMEDFVEKHKGLFKDKEVGVLITQGGFSGDGAYYLGRILKKYGAKVLCAEHFNMPDSITDNKKAPLKDEEISKFLNEANKKLDTFVEKFVNGKYIKRGFNPISRMCGSIQRIPWKAYYPKLQGMLKINTETCIGCGKCVKDCPTKNLFIETNKAKKLDKCTLCYKCVNNCPTKSITIFGKKAEYQYKGITVYLKDNNIKM